MKVVDPWSPIILNDNIPVENWTSIKSKIDAIFNAPEFKNSNLEKDGGKTSVVYGRESKDYPHFWAEFDFFKPKALEAINASIDKWKLDKTTYIPSESWVNIHTKGSWTEEHTHRGAQFVGVYYLHVPENSGRLLVRDPMEYAWGALPSDEARGINDIWYPVEVKTGDFVLFPSWLKHKTEESNTDESRYVMSINFVKLQNK
jgi:uncharacterized protein (TIGR02466 family)